MFQRNLYPEDRGLELLRNVGNDFQNRKHHTETNGLMLRIIKGWVGASSGCGWREGLQIRGGGVDANI
jgi:hypothetical protein